MKFKKILSVFLTFIMVISMMPCQISAATDLTWSGGTITLASGTKVGSAVLKTLAIYKQGAYTDYPEIASVTQDGNTIDITLAEGSDPSYPLQMGFAATGNTVLSHAGNTCTLQNGQGTASVTVSFRPAANAPTFSNTFTVNFTVIKGETYAVTHPTGEGFTFDGSSEASKDKDYSFNIAVNEGYDGTNMVVMVNGNEISASNGKYTVPSVSEELVITVEGVVKKEVLTITKPTGDGFTITGADTVYKNEDYTFTISVDNAFDASNMVVKANETVLVESMGKYTISAVSENIVITIEGIVAKTIYTVTLKDGEGYTISGQATSYANEPYTFTVSVDDAIYWADKIEVLVDGEKVTLTNGKYTFAALDSDKTVTVQNILERQILTVTKPETEGATISGDDTVREGKPYTFTVTIDEKYDGSNMVVKVNGNEITSYGNKYTVDITTEDIAIEISGIVKKDICEIIKPIDGKFTFTGEDFAYKGNDYVFTITPNLGYVATVTVNGETVEGNGNTYTVKTEDDEITIVVTTEKVSMPETELTISSENESYTVDIKDNQLQAFSTIRYAKVTGIKISGARVVSAFENGTTIYFNLHSDTPDDAEIKTEFLYTTDSNKTTLENSSLNVSLTDGETGKTHKVTAKYNNRTASATYNLIFFRELPAEEPPLCMKNSDAKEMWKDRSLEIDLSEYFTDADNFYLVNGEDKTPIEGKVYTFTSSIAGEHTLSFAAENEAGEATERLTVIVNVKDIESGVYIGHNTGNGSWNHIQFCDSEGNLIEGVEATYDTTNRVVSVLLPKTYAVDGTVKAKFDMTQNESGYPFVSTSTETTANRAFNSRFTEKNIALTGGSATFIFYYYNSSTGATNNGGQTKFTISIKIKNDKPVLKDGAESSTSATITAGENYTLDLSPLFTDVDEDELTYKVRINGVTAVLADANYSFTTDVAGTYTLVFTANDSKDDSEDTFTVTLTVENSTETDSMTVNVPEGLNPIFYVSSGFSDGVDIQGDILDAVIGETEDGLTAYTLNYPVNAGMISVRTDDFGGMAFAVQKDGLVTFRKVQLQVVDYDNNLAESTNVVTYGDNTAAKGSDGWLLVTDREYTATATPENTDLLKVTQNITIESGATTYIAKVMLGISNPMSITVPTGAKAELYKYNQYYSNTEVDAKIIKDNNDGTTTYQFIADTKANGASYIYRVSMEGKITKAGWLAWNQQNLTITYTENDKEPSYRLNDYSMTGEENSSIAEDSVLLNGNNRNHMNLSVGESKTLKAYRAWEIIPVSYNNYIITPDFTYTVLAGNDVVSLAEKDSPSAGKGDWMTLTALKEGIAIIEVTYDAIEVSGGSFDGVYGASDPNRSGILIVQVGENDDASVNFGIDGFASIGTSGSENITYNPNRKKDWDAEFDTLYFTGNSGELTFTPTASSEITEVSVSHDKGATWINLAGEDGVYNAEIIQGNNIIKVKTANGTAYQVVRGDKVTVKFAEVEGKSNDNGIVEAGETIRVYLNGLHNPIPKMAGNYNPGYAGNYEGYNSLHLNYTCNEVPIYGNGAQYNFITTANCIEVVMPDDGKDVTLCDGYIGLGVIGLTEFVNGGDSHRNIPDNGCTTRGSSTTYHTRSILPEITVSVGDTSAPNNAPIVRKEAVYEKEIYNDQNFAINPDTLFVDADSDTMTFTVSVNGAEAVNAPLDYKFTPNGVGTYTLHFTATDGKETAQHTITLTVTKRPSQGGSQDTPDSDDEFGLSASEIAGYVTISFTDNGVRVKGESGLKYPKALGTIIKATKVPYKDGEKITHVTKRLLDHLGIRMEYTGTLESGFYLGAICNFELKGTPYDSFGEFDAGVGSGWMITLNKTFIEYGASEFEVKNGDVIKWQYTCQLGKDIGDPFYSSSSSSTSSNTNNKTEDDKKEDKEETKTGTAQKVETTTNVTDNKATITTTESSIKDAVSKAEKENNDSIVISSADTKDATNITLEIPVSAAQNIAENSNLSIEVETTSGNVSISNETLNSIVEQIGTDENIKVAVETKTAENVFEAVSEESAKTITENVDRDTLEKSVIVEVNITTGDKHIRSFGGHKLTVDVPVDGKGHIEGKHYKVHIISADGKMDTTFGKCISKEGKLVIKVDTTHLSSFIVTNIETCPFSDVPNHWAYEEIKYVYENSIMQGTAEATFAPDENMTRAMLVTVLYRMENPDITDAENKFADVPDGEWYTEAVIWAETNGIVTGVSETEFAPNENVTREQMATILYRYAKTKGYTLDTATDLSVFTDINEISRFAIDAIRWANKTELVNGTSETMLSPKATATRAQVAAILMRFCENVAK